MCCTWKADLYNEHRVFTTALFIKLSHSDLLQIKEFNANKKRRVNSV